jgi:hypothetical protein
MKRQEAGHTRPGTSDDPDLRREDQARVFVPGTSGASALNQSL